MIPDTGTACGGNYGVLPGCAPLAVPYVPFQQTGSEKYNQMEGLSNGTLFPGLNLPFHVAAEARGVKNTALAELMGLCFAIGELGLYLDTHKDDREALELYTRYVTMEKEGRAKYVSMYGPLTQTEVAGMKEYSWVNDPWPWETAERRAMR